MKYLYENPNQAMLIVPLDEHEISLITSELKSKASSGHDELSSDVLMSKMNYFFTPLVHIISTSITTGIVHINMKIARVTPVFKVDDRTEMSNYRHISILPLFSKILNEKNLKEQWIVDVLQASNPDIAYDLFITKIKTICQKYFPFSTVKLKCKKKQAQALDDTIINYFVQEEKQII